MGAGDWIKLYRAMLDHPVMQDDRLCRIWVWCLLRANYAKGRLRSGAVLEPGQFAISIEKSACALSLAKSSLWRALKRLEAKKFGLISLKTERRFTVVTICNWSTYQTGESDTGTQLERNRNADGTQLEQIEERKEEKEEKEGKSRSENSYSSNGVKNHEAAFVPIKFRESLQAIIKRHPVKGPVRDAEVQWRQIASDEDMANQIDCAHRAFCDSKQWRDGYGVPSLVNFFSKGYWENPPEPLHDGSTRGMTQAEIDEYARRCQEEIEKELVA